MVDACKVRRMWLMEYIWRMDVVCGCFLVEMSSFGFCSVGVCFFQAEDGIRDVEGSRGLGDGYKGQRP